MWGSLVGGAGLVREGWVDLRMWAGPGAPETHIGEDTDADAYTNTNEVFVDSSTNMEIHMYTYIHIA